MHGLSFYCCRYRNDGGSGDLNVISTRAAENTFLLVGVDPGLGQGTGPVRNLGWRGH